MHCSRSIFRPWYLVVPIILTTSIATVAQEIQWTGDTNQDWNTATNWAGDAFPVNPQDGVVNIATEGLFPIISADSVFQLRDTIVGKGAAGRVDHRAGVHSTNSGNWTYIGQNPGGVGTYNLADTSTTGTGVSGFAQGSGTLNFGHRLYIGTGGADETGGSIAVMNVNTTGSINQSEPADQRGIYVGDNGGTGTLNLESGTINTHELYVGIGGQGKGVMNMTGGTVTVNHWMNVGDSNGGGDGTGQGTLNMSGGTLNQNHTDFFSFGQSGGRGTFNMSGGLLNDPAVVDTVNNPPEGQAGEGNITIGRFGGTGVGIWNISGESVLNIRDLRLAEGGESSGTLNMSGGTITQHNGQTLLGENGVGTLNLSGGVLSLRRIVAGDGTGATGNVTITGGELRSTANEIWFGQGGGTSTVAHSAGLVTANSWIAIGRDSGTAVYNLSGTGVLEKTGGTDHHVVLGSVFDQVRGPGTGTLNQSGGTFTTVGNGDVRMGENPQATGIWNFSAGTANVDAVRVGWANGGTGQLAVSGTAVLNATEIIVADQGATVGTVNQTGGTIHTTGNVDVQNEGTGTFTLSGGTLLVDGVLNLEGGTFNFTGGAISRSDTGTLSILGDLTTAADSILRLDDSKIFSISGELNKEDGITLDLAGLTIPAWDGTGVDTGFFALGTVGSILGEFDPALDNILNLVNNAEGATFISEAVGQGGFDPAGKNVFWVQENEGAVTLQYSNNIPEPGTASLLALACVGLAARRRRRR